MSAHKYYKHHCKGSFTVECALIFPLFLYAMLAVMYFFQIYHLHDVLQQAITKEGLNIARYGYVYQYIEDYEENHSISESTGEDSGKDSNQSAGENGVSDTLKNLLITRGINGAFFQLKLLDYVDEDYLNNSIIKGGVNGISALFSTFMGDDDCIDIVLSYYIKPPVALPGTGNFFILQRVTLRGWSGYRPEIKAENNEEGGEGYAYITESGSVYHVFEDCTYLKLSIQEASLSEIKNLRNISGGKYYPCELCYGKGNTFSKVYITDTGDRYHPDINCSALKRTVIKIPLSETGGRSLCKRCQMRQGKK